MNLETTDKMFELRDAGMTFTAIGLEVGVPRSTVVHHIMKRDYEVTIPMNIREKLFMLSKKHGNAPRDYICYLIERAYETKDSVIKDRGTTSSTAR